MARAVADVFTEVVIAPDFEEGVLEILGAKKNIRLLRVPSFTHGEHVLLPISGGALLQEPDRIDAPGDNPANWELAAGEAADDATLADLEFAWRACRSVKSNAILLASGRASVGVGMGQVNRVDSCKLAIERAGSGRLVPWQHPTPSSRSATARRFSSTPASGPLSSRVVPCATPRPSTCVVIGAWHSISPAPVTSSTDEAFMTAIKMAGVPVARQIKAQLRERVARLSADGVVPGLATVLVGDDPGSRSYVAGKHRDCAEVGIRSIRVDLPVDTSAEVLQATLEQLNFDPACTGYIVQLPLPKHLDDNWALSLVDPDKDADGLHPINLGRLVLGIPGTLPCTPRGIVELLRRHDVELNGAHTVIVGRGTTVGRPLGLLLTRRSENSTVTLCHTGTRDLASSPARRTSS